MAKKGKQMQLIFEEREPDEKIPNVIIKLPENSTRADNYPKIPIESRVLSVSELAKRICNAIDIPQLTDVCVQGEITGYRPHSSGHIYFSLSEQGNDKATIPCVMWKYSAKTVIFQVKDGALVRATGYVNFYSPYGKMQFVIKKLEPEKFGKTGLYLQKEEWKKQLTIEGVIPRAECNRRIPPIFPSCIGVVTSRTGSVLQDIRNVISRRYPLPILLAHTAVQGDGAHIQIAAAIQSLQKMADVIIVARGGGSFEELFEFNHPDVVRAVAASIIPVISAIGHETDTTLTDYAADCRMPTPSAAAETVVPDRTVLIYQLEEMRRTNHDAIMGRFATERSTLSELASRIDSMRLTRKLDQMYQQTADFTERIKTSLNRKIIDERKQCRTLGEMIAKSAQTRIASARLELLTQKEIIVGRDPYKPLKLGYTIVWKDRTIVRSAKNISTGDHLSLQFSDGKAVSIVKMINYDRET
ncbi:MAG TPA: exodeoxyribonuclease VII large subunit [Methanocorpusculum sp.]|nr:exodeoxyribonuclease VII large subunit [Methanocorpusculum sp.]